MARSAPPCPRRAASATSLSFEASRAASLAAHCAAGLSTAAGLKEAARLLRTAEALTRTAAALLSTLRSSTFLRSRTSAGQAAKPRETLASEVKSKKTKEKQDSFVDGSAADLQAEVSAEVKEPRSSQELAGGVCQL